MSTTLHTQARINDLVAYLNRRGYTVTFDVPGEGFILLKNGKSVALCETDDDTYDAGCELEALTT